MPYYTAQHIHNGHEWMPENSVIEVANDGTVIALHDNQNISAIRFDGALVPGFVNAHCHLELSHMKGAIKEKLGLIPFLKHIPVHRNDYTDEQKIAARHAGYEELVRNGVVAVGDIANTADTLDIRALDQLHFYTFVEALGFSEEKAQMFFNYAVNVYDTYAGQQPNEKMLRQAIVPHAPYSVSSSLFRLISAHKDDVLISIHNQESAEEDEYYINKGGTVSELLAVLGVNDDFFQPTGKSSLQSYVNWLAATHPVMFIHNTYTTLEDIRYAHSRFKEVYWCLCPNANLYIEDRLPDINLFTREDAHICVGTDSLASNHELSVLSELHTIKRNAPHIPWEDLFRWGTYNGARALQMQDMIGSIKPGKKPGIIHVKGLESTSKPFAERII